MTPNHIAAFFAACGALMLLDAIIYLFLRRPSKALTPIAVAAVCGLVFIAIYKP